MKIKTAIKGIWDRLKERSLAGLLMRLGWFMIIYLVAGKLFSVVDAILLHFNLKDYIHNPLLWAIYNISIPFWKLFYSDLSTSDYLVLINNQCVIQLFSGCSGFDAQFRITIILFLYPIAWKTKFWLFPLSWLIILLAATIHFILLIPIAYHWPDYYDFSHNWLTRFIFYGFYFLTWLIWERVGYPKKKMIRNTRSTIRDK